jgi:hypothetical protein
MSMSVPGLGARQQRARTDKADYVSFRAWSGSEVAESGNRQGRLPMYLSVPGLGARQQRARTDKADHVSVSARSGSEAAESGN